MNKEKVADIIKITLFIGIDESEWPTFKFKNDTEKAMILIGILQEKGQHFEMEFFREEY